MKKLFTQISILLGLTLAVACNGPAKEDEPIESKDLMITTSTRYILADGKDQVVFKISNAGVDVTAQSRIMNYKKEGSEELTSPSFKTSTAGEHTFYAIYNGAISAKIKVTGATAFPDLPVDAVPSKYDAFKKRVLAIQMTGLWCEWCPLIIKAMHDFNAEDPKASDVVFVSAHNGDALSSTKSNDLISEYGAGFGLPHMTFSLSKKNENQFSSDVTPQMIRTATDRFLASPATTTIAASSVVAGGKVCVRAEVKIGADAGSYQIGALLLEDGLVFEQTVASELKKEEYFNTHNNVIRAGFPYSASTFEPVDGKMPIAGKAKYQFYCEFDIKESYVADIAKTRVVIFVHDATKAECDNVVSFKVGDSLPFEYL